MRTPLIAGNWKMNGLSADAMALADAVVERAAGLDGIETVMCPPFVHLPMVGDRLKEGVRLGAQNCADAEQGARTGEIAADMLADLGVSYVILGHSERRQFYGEDDAAIAARYAQALKARLRPILCVGETLEERDAGRTQAVVAEQINGVVDRLESAAGLGGGVIAYEPVWAIGTGRTATAEQAQGVHAFIREILAERQPALADEMRLLYGGSMKPANAADLLAQPDVDGGLIGGASLDAEDFVAICAAAARG
ncbi:triose-phosphate isomerase [Spiribacter insolitus]|uniref:Triosephosphate isomerase n=1 Tax=Spiribacter insolitus TaxID=3122417 RepID=A0ABV3T6J0_9GAMM